MYKKSITYTDFLGQKRTEEFCFHMSEVELMKWASMPGGYSRDQVIDKMISSENNEALMDVVESLLKASYGDLSLDGKRFVKTPEVQANFFETNAYPALFLMLATDAEESARFFNGIFPDDFAQTVAKLKAANAAREAAKAAQSAKPAIADNLGVSTTANPSVSVIESSATAAASTSV